VHCRQNKCDYPDRKHGLKKHHLKIGEREKEVIVLDYAPFVVLKSPD
jgi:hypothetical protein